MSRLWLNVESSTIEELKAGIARIRLEPGRSMSKGDRSDLSGEAVWSFVTDEGGPITIVTDKARGRGLPPPAPDGLGGSL
jgi:hypothetical protein